MTFSLSPIRAERGGIDGLLFTVIQRTAGEASGVGKWEFDARTNDLYLSERARELLGVPADCEDVGAAVATRVHPEGR